MAPKFQQRHYEAIAELFWIRRQQLDAYKKRYNNPIAHINEWEVMQARFRNYFVTDSEKFDPLIFDKKCGRKS